MPESWHLPFEPIPGDRVSRDPDVWAGGVTVSAGSVDSPIGCFPVLLFQFMGQDQQLMPAICLVLDAEHMENIKDVIVKSIDAAITDSRRNST